MSPAIVEAIRGSALAVLAQKSEAQPLMRLSYLPIDDVAHEIARNAALAVIEALAELGIEVG